MKFYIKTFGCQMNVHDSRRISEILVAAGYESTDDPGLADIALVNSCTVREKAWHKAISEAGRLRTRKKKQQEVIVGMVGCVAQQEGERVFDLVSNMDLVVAPDHYNQLPYLISRVLDDGKSRCAVGFDEGRAEDFLTVNSRMEDEVSAFVTVMKGCEERCMYCIVPDVRGPERFRPADDIAAEVGELAKKGVIEITLLGQKVNAYQYGDVSFVDLLKRLDSISDLQRLRFTSPHPRHMTPELTGCFGSLRTLCEAIHIPVQSGSNRTLKRMRRRYTREDFLETIARLKAASPDIAISTDLIVGYPGETVEEFEETLSLIDEVEFTGVFSFKYSPRPGTPAAKLPDDVLPEEKARRLSEVHLRIERLENNYRESLLGEVLEVLVQGNGRLPGQLSGRARNFQIVNFVPDENDEMQQFGIGDLVPVKVSVVHPHSLEGVVNAIGND